MTYVPKRQGFSTIQSSSPNVTLVFSPLSFKSSSLVKRVFFLLNAAFSVTMLALISRVQMTSFIIMLLKLTLDFLTLCNDSHVCLLTCVYDCDNDSHQQKWFIHLGTVGRLSSAACCDLVFLVQNLRVVS